MKKSKFTIIGILITTIILAGVAIFTAIRLYQTRQTAVAPNVPSSQPLAANSCQLSFSFSVTTPTPTSTATSTATATATATSTSVPECNSTCDVDADCPDNLSCYKETAGSTGYCRNTSTTSCSLSTTCICQTSTPTTTATATATSNPQCNNNCSENTDCPNGLMCYIQSGATNGSCRNTSCLSETDCLCPQPTSTATTQPELPSVGTTWPTIVGTSFGILVILGSLLLAF